MNINLPDPNPAQIILTLGSLAVALIALRKVVLPALRWFADKVSWVGDLRAVSTGRPASVDRLTGQPRPEVPSLIDALVQIREEQKKTGTAVEKHGQALTDLTTVVTQVADQQITLGEHTRQIADLRLMGAIHAEQIGLLKAASGERTAMHQESAALFDAVSKRDVEVIDPQEEP